MDETIMYQGEARTFLTPNVARIAVGNGGVLNATTLEEKEVLVFANSVGISSLTAWDKSGRYATVKITVVPADTTRVLKEVVAFLQRIPRARAEIVGDKIVVDGDDLSDTDQERVALIAQRYPQVINFAGRVGWEKMIRLAVRVVELPTSEVQNLGVRWGGETGQTIGGFNIGVASDIGVGKAIDLRPGEVPIALPFPTRRVQGYFGINSLLSSQINLLALDGRAVVLAEPTLSTRSGSPASFLAGGEIPYSSASATGTPSVLFKTYGVKLEITPRVDVKTGTIRSTIETEVSDIDPTTSTSSGPALLTRRVRSEFNVREGETMVMSGFVQRRRANDVQKVPGLGDLPLVGSLFRSKSFVDRETQLLVLVTPITVDAKSPEVRGDVQKTDRIVERELRTPDRERQRIEEERARIRAQPSRAEPLSP
ncbi:pilus assembly protein N-terminal domain-containing protein [Aquabacterium sp. A7-Y]|uniref:type II and III secretion system protein family protein n=1 Tax=Aquabacterium sp. A7-Y TaxID=1349605 RepID=UPI00223CEFAC|nr:pilus assembly protein N-terminal domain-containing protein [Aquabacterium sp. A7-Y]MCW7540691.1 pilus assembly protein N-terminal domain-containing protein [Aquabacterium sp. A7-Y]